MLCFTGSVVVSAGQIPSVFALRATPKHVKLDVDGFAVISFRWYRRKIFATVLDMSADRTGPAQRAPARNPKLRQSRGNAAGRTPNAAGRGSEIGARVAALRARAGLTQGDVAERLGMSQRLLSYYEREASDIPASMLVPLADVLGVGVHELLGISESGPRKPGPKGYLQERFEAVREMPRKDQQFVVKFLDQVLEDYGRRRRKGGKRSKK